MNDEPWNPEFTRLLQELEVSVNALNAADPSGLFRQWWNWERRRQTTKTRKELS